MIALMVPFRTFSFLDFLTDLLQKSISVASNFFACCVFSVHQIIYMLLNNTPRYGHYSSCNTFPFRIYSFHAPKSIVRMQYNIESGHITDSLL
jgi:hypothetical protein